MYPFTLILVGVYTGYRLLKLSRKAARWSDNAAERKWLFHFAGSDVIGTSLLRRLLKMRNGPTFVTGSLLFQEINGAAKSLRC